MKDFLHEARLVSSGAFALAHSDSALSAPKLVSLPHAANLNAPVMNARSAAKTSNGWYSAAGKRAFDLVLILLFLPVWVPVVAICALALWIEGGTPFYRQDRLGKGGKRFSILKLRTMVMDADVRLERLLKEDTDLKKEWDTTQKLKDDPRITPVGRFLRKTSLDELPQLWNVILGEMSLVGPRPMLPEQLSIYGRPAAYFAMHPGITGVWQVSARNEDHFCLRAKLDETYAETVSFSGDVTLLYRTMGVVLRQTGY